MIKRRDKRGRILREGEYQLSDGRYRYRYLDNWGIERIVHSSRLDARDPYPARMKRGPSLRELEKKIKADLLAEIATNGGGLSVLDLVQKYIKTKTNVRPTTAKGYVTVVNILKNDSLGNTRIDSIKISDAKLWFINQQKKGRGYSSLHTIRGVLRPAFQMAVDDDLIRKNPFSFELSDCIINDSKKRNAVSPRDEERFLTFVKEDSHYRRYYEGIYILFKTGLRISEFCGLTIKDINFEEHVINIDHQLMRNGSKGYYLQKTKTDCGTRVLPMTPDVEECFRKIIDNRKKPRKEPVIGGKMGFLYLDQKGDPKYSLHWEKYFKFIVEKHNKFNEGDPLPRITPHMCRHTYCTNMAKAGIPVKVLQYLMGHSEINVTMNVYTHVDLAEAKAAVSKLAVG